MDKLDLHNVCGGAAKQLFERAVDELTKNLKDVNTPADEKRKIVLEFSFEPFADRSGAEVQVKCKHSFPGVPAVKGTIFVGQNAGQNVAYPKDVRQEALFDNNAQTGRA